MSRRFEFVMMVVVMSLFCSNLHAAMSPVPYAIHYQAQLKDADGLNVDKSLNVQVWIYSSATDGASGDLNDKNLLYAERHERVKIDRGKLRFTIGNGEGLGKFTGKPFLSEDVANAKDIYLKLIIDGEEIMPRQKLGYLNSGFKVEHAKVAENVDGEFTIDPDDMPLVDAGKITGKVPLARIPTNMSVSKVAGLISNDQVPVITLDKLTSGILDSALIGEIGKESITGGQFPSSAVVNAMGDSNIYARSGTVTHGQNIILPDQFTRDECSIFVGLKSIDVTAAKLSAQVHWADEIYVWADYYDKDHNYYTINCQFGVGTMKVATTCKAGILVFCTK